MSKFPGSFILNGSFNSENRDQSELFIPLRWFCFNYILSMNSANKEVGRSYVHDLVQKHPVVLFGRARCPACLSAKTNLDVQCRNIFSPENIKYIHLESLGPTQYSVSSFLQQSTGRNASPFIYIGGEFIGNNVDLRNLATSNKLQELLHEAIGNSEN